MAIVLSHRVGQFVTEQRITNAPCQTLQGDRSGVNVWVADWELEQNISENSNRGEMNLLKHQLRIDTYSR